MTLPEDWDHECIGIEAMTKAAKKFDVDLDLSVSHDEFARPFVIQKMDEQVQVMSIYFCPYCGKDLR